MKKFLSILMLFFIFIGTAVANEIKVLPSQSGIVKSLNYIDMDSDVSQVKQMVDIELCSGEYRGKKVLVENMLTGNPYYDIKLKKNARVLLHVEESDGELVFSIADVQRSNILLYLSVIFCGLLLYVGRKKGLFSLISILITCVLISSLLSPMIILGINPVLSTFFICLLSTVTTMYLVGGFNKKSSSAIIGTMLSLLFATILSLITVKLAHLTGFTSEHSMFLYSEHPELNFVAISVSMMILATLGAVMDVAMSIASTINEIYLVDNSKSVKELFVSGMNVGRDVIGTMANTLILVYLGASLPLLLLASNIDVQKFLNLNQVVTEIASALIGSSAIVICVPLTALVASRLVKGKCPVEQALLPEK